MKKASMTRVFEPFYLCGALKIFQVMHGIFTVILSFLCLFTLCSRCGGVHGFLKLETTEPDRQFPCSYNLTSSLNELQISFVFGKTTQAFSNWNVCIPYVESDFLRLAETDCSWENPWKCVCAAGNGVSCLMGFVFPDGVKSVTVPRAEEHLDSLSLWLSCKTKLSLFLWIWNYVLLVWAGVPDTRCPS